MNVGIHFQSLLTMVAAGVFSTAMFDTYKRLFRPNAYASKVIVDTLLMLTLTCFVYYLLFLVNGGVIRFYLFLAFLLGVSFYFAILQPVYLYLLQITLNLIDKTYLFLKRFIRHVIIRPITWIVNLLFTILISLLLFVWKVILFILKILLAIIRPFIPRIVQKYVMYFLTTCSKLIIKLKDQIIHYWTKWRRKNGKGESDES